MSQKVWRNSEGREFPASTVDDYVLVGRRLVEEGTMRALGYELVDASEGSLSEPATQATEIPSGNDESSIVAELKRFHERLRNQCGVAYNSDVLDLVSILLGYFLPQNPPSEVVSKESEPPKGESEEFEVVCHGSIGGYKDEEDCGVPVMKQTLGVVHHPRLIPGKTYVVRLKGEK